MEEETESDKYIRIQNHIKAEFKKLLELQRQITYTEPEKHTDEKSVSETAGVLLSNFFQWTEEPLINCFLSALEDSNFHELREVVEEAIRVKK